MYPIKSIFITGMILLFFTAIAQAQPGMYGGGTPEQMADRQTSQMTEWLQLTADQIPLVREINLAHAIKAQEMRKQQVEGEQGKNREAMAALRAERNAALKEVLTPEQYDKLQTRDGAPGQTDKVKKDKKDKKKAKANKGKGKKPVGDN